MLDGCTFREAFALYRGHLPDGETPLRQEQVTQAFLRMPPDRRREMVAALRQGNGMALHAVLLADREEFDRRPFAFPKPNGNGQEKA